MLLFVDSSIFTLELSLKLFNIVCIQPFAVIQIPNQRIEHIPRSNNRYTKIQHQFYLIYQSHVTQQHQFIITYPSYNYFYNFIWKLYLKGSHAYNEARNIKGKRKKFPLLQRKTTFKKIIAICTQQKNTIKKCYNEFLFLYCRKGY